MQEQKTIETARLVLRPWRESDAEELFSYAKDPRVGPAAGWQAHKNVEESRTVLREILMVPETYAIVWKETGKPIGSIGLHHNDLAAKEEEAELGYWLGVPFWGRGIVPEAAAEILRHAFLDLHLNRVWCAYYDGNEKSRRVQEKLGFVHQWTAENVPVPQMNEIRKGHVNLLTKENWLQKSGRTAVVYVHGKGGDPREAETFRELFPDADVTGFAYRSETPWDAKAEFHHYFESVRYRYRSLILIANSIGAYFAMCAGNGSIFERAFFISPVTDPEVLIKKWMKASGISDALLKEKKTVSLSFGVDLSWEYLSYVRSHPVEWIAETHVLFGEKDELVSLDDVRAFADATGAELTVLPGAEHWIHTENEMRSLKEWIRSVQERRRC